MFLYWGRRGLSRFALEVGRVALAENTCRPTISVSRQNERFGAFEEFGEALFPVTTFTSNIGAGVQAWRVQLLRRQLAARLRRDQTKVAITLMPHVWTPLVASVFRQNGVRYVTIVHDAQSHPGDPTGLVHGWLLRDMRFADLVVSLSSAVAERLEATGRVERSKILTLFYPDLSFGPPASPEPPRIGEPFRLLFLGRIMPYKGLPMMLDALDHLSEQGLPFELGVFGEGPLGPLAERLARMGAEVVNRWLSEEEIGNVLLCYHAVVLPYVEASQSGVLSAALGSGVPVISSAAGGLPEQVSFGELGIVASHADAKSLAAAIAHLYHNPQLYRSISERIRKTREDRSVQRFATDLIHHSLNTIRPAY